MGTSSQGIFAMLSTARSKGLERVITSAPSASIPAFLLPAFPTVSTRSFSSSVNRPSQIGRAPLSIPPEVNFTILPPPVRKNGRASPIAARPTVQIEGPLGKMSLTIPNFVNIEHDTAVRKAYVTIEDREVKKQREMWGTTRAYLQNHILGVSEGHTAILRLVGVGYRAPIELPVPKGVKASTPQPTRILLEGCEKEVVLQFAAKIRMWRKPEPYKGKGIFVNGETIKLKAKKIK